MKNSFTGHSKNLVNFLPHFVLQVILMTDRTYLEKIQDEISESLYSSANGYFHLARVNFHLAREMKAQFQPVIGNFSISIELFLKGYITQHAFRFLYTDIPLELQVMLSYPEHANELMLTRLSVELKTFNFKTIDLGQSIALFFILEPDAKPIFTPYFKYLNTIRNPCVHGTLPNFHRFDLERVAYASFKLFQYLTENNELKNLTFHLREEDESFLKRYDDERTERVKKAIEAAKQNVKKLNHSVSILGTLSEDWDNIIVLCPVCNSNGEAGGYSEADLAYIDDDLGGESPVGLTFYASSFKCSNCSLELADEDELELAGMPKKYDRSVELSEWLNDNW